MVTRITLLMVLFGLGCAPEPSHMINDDHVVKSAAVSDSNASFVRLGLAELTGELPEVGYTHFLDDASVVETVSVGGSEGLDSSLRKMLLVLVGERTEKLSSHVVKIQKFRINQDFPAVRLLSSRLNGILPFKLKAGAEIEFARVYDSEAQSHDDDSFSLLDYPYNAESSLRLPEGTVVTIPVHTSVSVDVGGAFVSKSTRLSPQLLPYLDTSAMGSMSAARRGTLVGEGRFKLQIARLGGDRVRVRLLSAGEQSVNAIANLGSFFSARYAFIPAARLDRLRSLKRRLDQLGDGWAWISEGEQRIQRLREQLPDLIRNLVDSTPLPIERRAPHLIDAAVQIGDDLMGEAERLAGYASDLDERIGDTVSQVLNGLESVWDQRIEPVTRTIQNLSSRVFSIAQSVQLDDGLTRHLTLLADYEFDLSSEDARIAFDRAISNRAVWRGAIESLSNWNLEEMTFVDFTLADTMAAIDAQLDNPRVRRLAQGGSDLRRRAYSLSVNAFGLSVGLNGEFQNNRVILRDENGQTSEWYTRAWERGQNTLQLFGQVRSETFASGAFSNRLDDDVLDGGYWFRWHKTFSYGAQAPIRTDPRACDS